MTDAAQINTLPVQPAPLDLSGLQSGISLLRHNDGREGTFVEIEPDGRARVQSLKGKGFWIFHPQDCGHVGSRQSEPAKPLNRRQTAKIATRSRIIAAARALFEDGTYAEATIRGIARAAGMSTGAVFATVPDKAALWTAVYGGPAPDPDIADEIARTLGALPDHGWMIARRTDGRGSPFHATLTTPDFDPVERTGQCFGGRGATPAAALRQARENATHAVRQGAVQ